MRDLYYYWEEALSDQECDNIIEECKKVESQEGTVFGDDEYANFRNSTIRWVHNKVQGLDELIWKYVNVANRNSFNVDVTNIFEIQFTEYHGTEQQYYSWHDDVDWTGTYLFDRKLSFVLQLSDPDDYEGGQFVAEYFTVPKEFQKRGSIIVFPSMLKHQVTPVTKGTRYSLVSWIEGPRWR